MIHSRRAVKLLSRIGVYAGASVLLFAGAASGLQAAEENGAAASTEIFKWINFAIVAAVIIWVFAKKLPPIFRANAEKISSAIGKAAITKAEADRQLGDAQAKLGNMKQEIDALRATAEKDSVAEGERLRNQTRTEVTKIAAAAKAEIEAEERAARMELKAIAAKLAVDGAEALVVKQLNAAAQEAVLANFANSLKGAAN